MICGLPCERSRAHAVASRDAPRWCKPLDTCGLTRRRTRSDGLFPQVFHSCCVSIVGGRDLTCDGDVTVNAAYANIHASSKPPTEGTRDHAQERAARRPRRSRSFRSSKATAPAPTSGAPACASSTPRSRRRSAASAASPGSRCSAGEKAKNQYGEWLPNDTLEAVKRLQGRHQGPADDAGRRRHPQPERHAAAGARSLRLRAAGPLLRGHAGAGDAPGADERRHLPREHRGRLRRHRVGARARRRPRSSSSSSTREMGKRIRPDSGIGIKPISEFGTKRLVRMAIQYAIDNKRKTVTLVHKGNIMKFTEGAFRDWGYEVAKAEFRDQHRHRGRGLERRVARRQDPHQRPHRRQRVPAGPDADRRLRRVRDAEPQRRLPLRRLRGAGRRPRHGARREHRRRHRASSRPRTARRRSTPARTSSTRRR